MINGWEIEIYGNSLLASEALKSQHPDIRFPTMAFPENRIAVWNETRKISVDCLDVLRTIRSEPTIDVKVIKDEYWKNEVGRFQTVIFDWTYLPFVEDLFELKITDKSIDLEKVRFKGLPLLAKGEAIFYEDELSDFGLAKTSVWLQATTEAFLFHFTYQIDIPNQSLNFVKTFDIYSDAPDMLLFSFAGKVYEIVSKKF